MNNKQRTYFDFHYIEESDENEISSNDNDPFEICGLSISDILIYYYHQYFQKESTALEKMKFVNEMNMIIKNIFGDDEEFCNLLQYISSLRRQIETKPWIKMILQAYDLVFEPI